MEGDRPRFQRIYIYLAACLKGFLDGCRPVVCLDECHVKGPHPGQVLSAMGVDANNGMFPLAYVGIALKHQMEAIARSTTVPWFHVEMRKMLQLSKHAHDWLVEKDLRHWSRAYFKSDSKCDMLMNNLCEAFNRSIMDARDKPILTMLERIWLYIMLLMAGRRVLCEK
ncbi:unnamed protein product [Prunus armeniaca]